MKTFKLAIVGGGPSAFYVASRILKTLPENVAPNLRVHLFNRLWAPHGLVRYGVAPDHPEVKASLFVNHILRMARDFSGGSNSVPVRT